MILEKWTRLLLFEVVLMKYRKLFFFIFNTYSRIFSNRLMLQVVLPEGSKNPQPIVPFATEKHLEVSNLSFLTLSMSPPLYIVGCKLRADT